MVWSGWGLPRGRGAVFTLQGRRGGGVKRRACGCLAHTPLPLLRDSIEQNQDGQQGISKCGKPGVPRVLR